MHLPPQHVWPYRIRRARGQRRGLTARGHEVARREQRRRRGRTGILHAAASHLRQRPHTHGTSTSAFFFFFLFFCPSVSSPFAIGWPDRGTRRSRIERDCDNCGARDRAAITSTGSRAESMSVCKCQHEC